MACEIKAPPPNLKPKPRINRPTLKFSTAKPTLGKNVIPLSQMIGREKGLKLNGGFFQ